MDMNATTQERNFQFKEECKRVADETFAVPRKCDLIIQATPELVKMLAIDFDGLSQEKLELWTDGYVFHFQRAVDAKDSADDWVEVGRWRNILLAEITNCWVDQSLAA